jgi:hypothetical protein
MFCGSCGKAVPSAAIESAPELASTEGPEIDSMPPAKPSAGGIRRFAILASSVAFLAFALLFFSQGFRTEAPLINSDTAISLLVTPEKIAVSEGDNRRTDLSYSETKPFFDELLVDGCNLAIPINDLANSWEDWASTSLSGYGIGVFGSGTDEPLWRVTIHQQIFGMSESKLDRLEKLIRALPNENSCKSYVEWEGGGKVTEFVEPLDWEIDSDDAKALVIEKYEKVVLPGWPDSVTWTMTFFVRRGDTGMLFSESITSSTGHNSGTPQGWGTYNAKQDAIERFSGVVKTKN